MTFQLNPNGSGDVGSEDLVSTDWLMQHLNDPGIIILDGSFKLPGTIPTAEDDYQSRHIPGAQFFDIDAVADRQSRLPHMLPSASEFSDAVSALGIGNDTFVVVYDTLGLMSAGRVWWMFRTFGHEKIAILNGGLKSWLSEGRPTTAEISVIKRGQFTALLDASAVASKKDVLNNIESRTKQLVDARSAARFKAVEKEARPDLRSGHIPGSLNVPFNLLTDRSTGKLKTKEEIAEIFTNAGLDPSLPTIASCGSGVTACVLVFGLHLLGKQDVVVYDGAWTEWGAPGETPVE